MFVLVALGLLLVALGLLSTLGLVLLVALGLLLVALGLGLSGEPESFNNLPLPSTDSCARL